MYMLYNMYANRQIGLVMARVGREGHQQTRGWVMGHRTQGGSGVWPCTICSIDNDKLDNKIIIQVSFIMCLVDPCDGKDT